MLQHPILDKLEQLRFNGMATALREQMAQNDVDQLSFMERFGLLIDREESERYNKRLKARLRRARLRQAACMEDLDYRNGRNLDRRLMVRMAACQWVRQKQNVVITGPTGVGKSFVACALAHKACIEGYTVRYYRLARLLEEIALARADGRYIKQLQQIARVHVLVLDDWALTPINRNQQQDLIEILDDRHLNHSTIVTSQMPVKHWHQTMENPTLADAILDRLVHNAHHIVLEGESMRKRLANIEPETPHETR